MLCRLIAAGLLLLALPLSAADKAKSKAAKLTLEDVVFDAQYLRQALGPKTLLTFEKPVAEIPASLAEALKTSGLADATKFMVLPPEFGPPKVVESIPYNYPTKLRRGRTSGEADFLVLIGADGKVKTIHCYQHSDRMFALAVAAAVVRWQYAPTKIQETALPVLLAMHMSFVGDGSDNQLFHRPAEPEPIPPPPT
ncbi:Gram-negative bacterial tonB protein [Lacunisphaera limnophila]|uniref:Gram-negative bacterial tonB protein n=2 Tax=Lacunisphaera limnophila TaxID=1838286 RepID=A0A1D8AXP8_9BACT|nr:Gram-negative bacterial tonB protein [Lacunisphaera limnophila]